MKLKIITLLVTAIAIASCTSTPKTGYQINGNLPGVEGKLYLSVFEGKMPVRIDSTELVNGAFTFTGSRDLPILAAIETSEKLLNRFFLENSEITINSDATTGTITVTGSVNNDLYTGLGMQMNALAEQVYNDSLAQTQPQLVDSLSKVMDELPKTFVANNPTRVAAAYVLFRELSYMMTHQELSAAVAKLDASIQESVYVQLVKSMIESLQKSEVGQPFIDFTAPDVDGNEVALSSIAGKDKYVLVDFWASWCPPCRAEMPTLVAAYNTYNPKGFEIVGVSLDKNKADWTKGIKDLNQTWIHLSDLKYWDCAAAALYGVRSIPSNVLIAPDGKIIARNLHGEELEQILSKLFQ